MNKNWINFKELRNHLPFDKVFELYGIQGLSLKGSQYVGFCPLPGHNGNKKSASFSAHPEKRIFQCFGCGAKGNILDFAVLMDNGNPRRGLDVRRTALKLHKQFGNGAHTEDNGRPAPPKEEEKRSVVNEPLNFCLKELDSSHPYLMERGFTQETMDKFGVGFCSKGLFAGRIAIPLHDSEDRLIGYAGRVIDDQAVSPDNPKYLFPSKRERDGEMFEFKKSLFLYNGSRFQKPVADLAVVEGFASVWWLTQCGFPESVAIMGSSFSEEQLALIFQLSQPTGRIWILADGDDAGTRWKNELASAVVSHRLCRAYSEPGRQPTDYSCAELESLLGM
jgi:DNA primase